jgi:hypothetical protein
MNLLDWTLVFFLSASAGAPPGVYPSVIVPRDVCELAEAEIAQGNIIKLELNNGMMVDATYAICIPPDMPCDDEEAMG